MNSLLKIGVGTALAMGFAAAHATTTVPGSYSTGTVYLFADVVNSSGQVIGAYAADTTVTVDSVTGGTAFGTLLTTDGNLTSLLNTLNSTAGATLVWGVVGGGGGPAPNGDPSFVTTSSQPAKLANITGSALSGPWQAGWIATAQTISSLTGSGKSVVAATPGGAGGWDAGTFQTNGIPANLVAGPVNWYAAGGPQTGITGLNTTAELYGLTSTFGSASPATITNLGSVTLTASGLSFSAPSAVPLPAAIWLLGSGLLGLAGVGRRKAAVAA